MSYKLIVYDSVTDEVESAALYYESKQKDLGLKLLNDWENTLEVLGRNPLNYQKKYKHFR